MNYSSFLLQSHHFHLITVNEEKGTVKYKASDKDSHESSQYLHEFSALILLVWKNKFD